MQAPPKPDNEEERLQTLLRLDVLDTESEDSLDRATRLASRIARTPIALVSLVDDERQWFKSKVGLDASETPRDISFCGHAILENEPFVVIDASQDPRFSDNPLVTGAPHIRFYLGVPLEVGEGVNVGTLCVIDSKTHMPDPEEIASLEDLAGMVAHELELRRAVATDPLTGAYNRRMFDQMTLKEMARAEREDRSFSIAVFDLDYFKKVNDTYGHDAGDAVLVEVAKSCSGFVRKEDTVFRLGGEEFAVMLIGSTANDAVRVLERMREHVESLNIRFQDHTLRVTTSVGVSEFRKGQDRTVAEIVKRADMALYEAKGARRNRVMQA